ncbi:alpha-L-rhamnosidase-related protein [Sediminibacterium soli]|uniref:alpha-L-rhamnosidase-related protein n=1 Tax=Sediminibacterium soli TaxID=2698829 RepID=UPI001379F844|nr:alpha-rhamnosidase [Sediminibacterium soli]NCI48190.1 alpha-rhamnosidase [Sediminibacterium soli]
MRKQRTYLVIVLLVLMPCQTLLAQRATWIWYPGDFDIWLANKMQNRRTERGIFFPVFWKMDSHYVLMDFHKTVQLLHPDTVSIYAEGEYNVKLDGRALEGSPQQVIVPAGQHRINIKVFSQAVVPSVFVRGKTIVSDSSWLVTFEDKEWIDETGKTSDISATRWQHAGSWNFYSPLQKPSAFRLPTQKKRAVSIERHQQSLLVDFGKETFGFIQLHGLKGKGRLSVYYGESKEEALSADHCETLDRLDLNTAIKKDSTLPLSKAFRYVQVQYDGTISIDSVSMLYEYADVTPRGSFTCSDTAINKIYDVAKYTFSLNTREFFIDGIKRDRWVWSGDAYQSFLMNYYLFFDEPTVTRTLAALRGKDPVTAHINTIMDYTFYWFLGIYDYYQYTGNRQFIEQNYDRMKSLMEYCLGRRNQQGLMEGLPGDWVFVDWAQGLSKKGALSFEQVLLARGLETMALCAGIAGDRKGEASYRQLSGELRKKIFSLYWNDNKQALVHSYAHGRQTETVTRYSNMFAIFFNYFNETQKQAVRQSVLLNPSVQKITTPYMRFYELEALCAMGEQKHVLEEIKNYWGGMLRLGATSFWEEYDPAKQGTEHYAMYGREFGKSLCHAWGAGPLYLMGKYYLGVKPVSPGYASYLVTPELGGLQWMQGSVPTPAGTIDMYVTKEQVRIQAPAGLGILRIKSRVLPAGENVSAKRIGQEEYEIAINPATPYTIHYQALK